MSKDSLIWVSENEADKDGPLLAGRHGEGGYSIAMLIDFCESDEHGRRFDFEQFRETWGKPPTHAEWKARKDEPKEMGAKQT